MVAAGFSGNRDRGERRAELPWEDYLFRLDGELGRDGPVAIEHITDPDILRAKTFIETIAKKIGVTWTH